VSKARSGAGAVLPAWTAPVVVVLGTTALLSGSLVFRGFGMRGFLMGSEALLVVPSLVALALFRIPLGRGLALVRLPRRSLLLCAGLGATLWAASLGLFELQYAVWAPPPGYLEGFQRLHELLKADGVLDSLFSLAAIAFAPAVCEEIVFRGSVLPALDRRFGSLLAALGSALLFGLIHIDAAGDSPSFYRVPFAFAVGLGLAALRLRTGSLWASIVAHATLNGITYFAAPFAGVPDGALPDPRPLLGAGLFAAGILASALLYAALPALLTRDPGNP
jgi:membrane protease YdiL (CAAX protease family)